MSGRFSNSPKQRIKVVVPITNTGSDTEPIIGTTMDAAKLAALVDIRSLAAYHVMVGTQLTTPMLAAATTAFTANTLPLRDANGYLSGGTWNAASFATNWSNFGAPWQNVEYKIDTTKRVHLRGMCKKSVAVAAPDTVFTLATGFRPAADEYFTVNSNGAFGTVFVTSAGLVRVQVGNATYVSLSGISFDAA